VTACGSSSQCSACCAVSGPSAAANSGPTVMVGSPSAEAAAAAATTGRDGEGDDAVCTRPAVRWVTVLLSLRRSCAGTLCSASIFISGYAPAASRALLSHTGFFSGQYRGNTGQGQENFFGPYRYRGKKNFSGQYRGKEFGELFCSGRRPAARAELYSGKAQQPESCLHGGLGMGSFQKASGSPPVAVTCLLLPTTVPCWTGDCHTATQCLEQLRACGGGSRRAWWPCCGGARVWVRSLSPTPTRRPSFRGVVLRSVLTP
jgi:hypothetical protein